jgi:hypothetical protein
MANRGRLFMQQDDRVYKWLSEEQRKSRRSIADAIAVLRKEADFGEHDCATIRILRFALPSGEVVGTAAILFAAPWEDTTYCVALPTAARFKGYREGSTRYDHFAIIRLNKAEVDASGTVVLADETILDAVKVIPARMPLEPSELDWMIVHATLSIIAGGDRCYRSWREDMSPAFQDSIPDQRFLDCSKLRELKDIPPLNVIANEIARTYPELKASSQKIADALRAFGIRVPVPRPRQKASRERTNVRVG